MDSQQGKLCPKGFPKLRQIYFSRNGYSILAKTVTTPLLYDAVQQSWWVVVRKEKVIEAELRISVTCYSDCAPKRIENYDVYRESSSWLVK